LASLRFPPGEEWLGTLYAAKLDSYLNAQSSETHNTISTLAVLSSFDSVVAKAERAFYHDQYSVCFDLTSNLLSQDPFNQSSRLLALHVSALVELGLKNELFYFSHKLVKEHADSAVTWYSVGCYYFLIQKYDPARRYFSKSTSIDSQFGPAWLGFGHSFAAQGEHDQAMAAYRTAAKLLQGCHLPPLFVAMELLRVHNLTLAIQFVQQAKELCSFDPLVYNELGVIAYKNKEYKQAVEHFQKALQLCGSTPTAAWESTVVNLAHSYRKLRDLSNAIKYYELALYLVNDSASTHAALGFAYHLKGNFDKAIDLYHQALSIKPDDSFANELLARGLEDALNKPL